MEPYDRNRRVLVASGIVALVLIVVPPVLGALAASDPTTWRGRSASQDARPVRDPRVLRILQRQMDLPLGPAGEGDHGRFAPRAAFVVRRAASEHASPCGTPHAA